MHAFIWRSYFLPVADLGGGGALGASAPPGESMVKKNLNLPFFFSMYGRYLFACSVSLD